MKSKLMQRMTSGLLAVMMIFSMIQLPQPAHAAAPKPTDDSLTVFDKLGFDTGAPEGYQQEEPITDTPYGRQFVSVNTVDELVVYSESATIDTYGVDKQKVPLPEANGGYFSDESRKTKFYSDSEIKKTDGLGNMTAEASIILEGNFSDANHGKRANMIMVGLEPDIVDAPDDGRVYANMNVAAIGRYVYNVPSGIEIREQGTNLIFGTMGKHVKIGNPTDGKRSDDPGAGSNGGNAGQFSDSFKAYNYLAAAVGDFDADGIDEIAWYVPEAAAPRIEIWDLQNSAPGNAKETAPFMHAENWKLAQVFRLDIGTKGVSPNMVSLVSSDFDRDGIDDLAVTWGNLTTGTLEANPGLASQAAVLWGSTLNEDQGASMLAKVTPIPLTASNGREIARAAFTVGDADGDGHDDLVLGGSYTLDGPYGRYLAGYRWNGSEFVRFMEKHIDLQEKNENGKYISSLEMDGKGTTNLSRNYYSGAAAKANVAVGNFFGPGEAPGIYLDSMMIANTADGLKLVDIIKPNEMNVSVDGAGQSYAYVERGARAATLGTEGRDTLVTVNQYYFHNMDGKSVPDSEYAKSSFLQDMMTTFELYKGSDNYYRENARGLSAFNYEYRYPSDNNRQSSHSRVFQQASDTISDKQMAFALPDMDDDTIFMAYTGEHYYRYADPEVVAVLASPPYFEDLTQIDGELDDSSMVESSTKYGASTGTGSGNTTVSGFSAGIYMGMEQDIKFMGITLASYEMEAEMNNHFTWETENLNEVTYEITYENILGQDGVVLCAMPVETYVYKSYSPDGKGGYQETDITVNIPYEPSVRVINLEQYQEIYKDYQDVLPRVDSSVLSHTLGDPRSYPSSLQELPSSLQVMSYPGDPSEIGQGGKSSITQTIEMTSEYSNSFNYEFELNFKMGGGIGGMKAGVTGGMNFGSGSVQVSTSGSTYEATMLALPSIAADYGYSFNWRLVGFLYNEDGSINPFAEQYPVVTYLVTSERVPPQLPDNFHVNDEGTTSDSVRLEWDYTGAAAGFVIYRYFESTSGSDYYEIATVGFNEGVPNSDGSNHFSFVDSGLAADAPFSYRIQTIGNAMPNLSVPSGSLHTFTKPLDYPEVKVTEDHLQAYPDNEVSVTAYVENAGAGSYEYSWQKLENGQWKTLSAVANPNLDGLKTATMTLSFADEGNAGQYRCQVVKRTSQSKILKSYSPAVTVDFERRTAVPDGEITINGDKSISVRLKGGDTTSVPGGNVTFSLTQSNKKLDFSVPVDFNGEARLSDLDLTPGVYSVTAYYGGNRIFKPLSVEPDPVKLYATGITSTSTYTDVKETYTYGDELNITLYTVDESGNVTESRKLTTLAPDSLEYYRDGSYYPITSGLNSVGQSRLTQTVAGWAGQYRLTLNGEKHLFSIEPKVLSVGGLNSYYMTTQDQVDPLSDFLTDLRSNLQLTPEAPLGEKDAVLKEWIGVKEYGGSFLNEQSAVRPGHYYIMAELNTTRESESARHNYIVKSPKADLAVTGAAHKLTVGVYQNDASRGSVRVVNPRNAQHATAGQTVLMEATANPGFEVDCWMLNGNRIEGSEGKNTLGIVQGDSDSNIVVRFRYRQNILTIRTMPETPAVNGQPVENEVLVDDDMFFNGSPCAAGHVLNLTPKAAEGWHFEKWEYLEEGQPVRYLDTPELKVTMPNASVLIRAIFVRDSYTLTLGEHLNAFDGNDLPLTDLSAVPGDAAVTVRVADGFQKAQQDQAWTVDGAASDQTGDSFTFTMLRDTAVTVPTVAGKYSVSVYAEGLEGGTASVTPSGMVPGGTSVTFKAETERDYSFQYWDFGGDKLVKENPYTTTVESNLNATPVIGPREGKYVAVYGQVDWNISGLYTQPDYGAAPQIYPGESLTLTAFPNRGEMVSGWMINDEYRVHPSANLTLTYDEIVDGMVVEPCYQPSTMVKVTTLSPYIHLSQDGMEIGSDGYVAANSEVICTFDPPEEDENGFPIFIGLENWLVDGKPLRGAKERTLVLNVDKPTTVDVKTVDHTVTVSLNGWDGGVRYFDFSLEFSDLVSNDEEGKYVVGGGSSMLFRARLKPEYEDSVYVNEKSMADQKLIEKDGEWLYYEEIVYIDPDGPTYRAFKNPLCFVKCYEKKYVEVLDDGNGTITVDNNVYFDYYQENKDMVITAHPNEGYQLETVTLEYVDEKTGEIRRMNPSLNENGELISRLSGYGFDEPTDVKLKATFCPDTPQPVRQVILPDYGINTIRTEDEVFYSPYLLLPANHTDVSLKWIDNGPDSENIIISPDGAIRMRPDFNRAYRGSYGLEVTNADGSMVSAVSSVDVIQPDYLYITKIAAPPHISVDVSECDLKNGSLCYFHRTQTIRLIIEEGYELDKIEAYMIKSRTPVEVEPVTESDPSAQKPGVAYEFYSPQADVMIVITEKPVDGSTAVKPHDITCLDQDEHLSLRFTHEKAYAGETVKLQTNVYLPQLNEMRSELIPEVGYELDLAGTTIVGSTTGAPVEFTLNEMNELCFVMPDESVTITPAVKTWETDPRVTVTVINGTVNGKHSDKVFKDGSARLQADEAVDNQVFAQWTADTDVNFGYEGRPDTDAWEFLSDTTVTATYRLISPADPSERDEYRLYVTGGTGSGLYKPGQILNVQAIIPAGKMFKQWYIQGIETSLENYTNPNITFEMPAQDVNIHAALVDAPANVYTLTVVNGTGSGNYTADTKITARAVPPAGMIFKSWEAEGLELTENEKNNNTLVFLMPENHVVLRPVFEKASYAVNVIGGSGDGGFHPGDMVTVTADTVPGHRFIRWTTEGIQLDNPRQSTVTFRMPNNAVFLTANFEGGGYAVKVVGGTGSGLYAEGETVRIRAEIPEGKVFDRWISQDGVAFANASMAETSFVMPAGAVQVTAVFTDEQQPQPENLFRLAGANVIMGNNLDMMFAIPQDAVSDWDGHYAEIRRSYSDGRPAETLRIDFADWKQSGGVYIVTYNGIAAKEMIDDLTVTVYDASGKAVSQPWNDSLRSYAMRILEKSRDALQKTLLVDMLNYGAASQKHFGYAATDLANNRLSPDQKALTSELKPFESKLSRGDKWMASNLILESNIRLMVGFRELTPDMNAMVQFVDHMGHNVRKLVPGTDFEAIGGGNYAVVIEDLVVADARMPVSITIYEQNGEEVTSCEESIEDYLARMNGVSDLFASVMKFADSAYAYLHQ